MPVVAVAPALKSPPSNAFGLVQYLQQRLPGFDTSEYLRELNSAYVHVWEEITKLKNHYFTNTVSVTVAKSQFSYDLMFNADGGLSAPVSARLYQFTRVRFKPPSGGLFQLATFVSPVDPDFVSMNANPTSPPSVSGPYICWPSGRNQLQCALPPAVGTTIEVTYTFWPISMVILFNGTVSSTTNAVTGNSTNFTNMVQPDFQSSLPTVQGQEEVQAELVCNGSVPLGGQIYRVTAITSDTALTTATAISPALPSGSSYVLATLPEIPREHIKVVASIAMAKMYSVDGDDARVSEWTAISTQNMAMMKDALMERQSQNPARKIRFPGSLSRSRNRTFLR